MRQAAPYHASSAIIAATFSPIVVAGTTYNSAAPYDPSGTLQIETQAPNAPLLSLDAANDTGLTGDNTTNQSSVTIDVSAEAVDGRQQPTQWRPGRDWRQ